MTLIEVLVAMLILSVGATSLIALFASASATHKRAVDRTHGALIAEEIFSEVQARYFLDEDLRDVLRDLSESLPSQIDGYYWSLKLYRPGATRPAGEDDENLDRGAVRWGDDELIARLAIQTSREVGALSETYTTILLPRPLGARP